MQPTAPLGASPERSEPASTERREDSRRASLVFALCAFALFVLHALLVNSFVPFRVVFGDRPIQGFDYDLHIGQVYRVVDALTRWGASWVYDVQLLAGQPEGTITDAGSKGWELWTFLLYRLGVPRAIAFNSFILANMLMAPVWVFLAGLNFRLGRWGALLAGSMASTLWFFDSHLHWVWFVGMISWSGASCLALFTIADFYRFVEHPAWFRGGVTGLCLSICLLIHPYTFFVLAVPLVAMYARAWRRLSRHAHAGVVAIGALALVVNAFWLHNAASHWHYVLNSAFYAQANPLHLVCDFFDVLCNGLDTGVIGTRAGFRFTYFALAAAGLVLWAREADDRVLPLGATLVALVGFAYLGVFVPGMQQTQPYRQITPAMLLACLPAAAGMTHPSVQRAFAEAGSGVRALVAALCFGMLQLLLATQVLYFFPELVPRPQAQPDGTRSPFSGYGHTSHPGLPDHVRYDLPHETSPFDIGTELCLQWLHAHAQRGDRVLIEPPILGERLAWRGRLEVLGGFFERNVMHVDANYFRRYMGQHLNAGQLADYLRTFAVQWVVGDRAEFHRAPDLLERVDAAGPYPVYRTRLPVDRVLGGGGKVSAAQNRIRVTGSDPNRALLLSYHWHEALRCAPDCRVERQELALDRVGLIRVPAPHPSSLSVWIAY